MTRKRMLNQDYYKLDAKTMRKSIPQEQLKQVYKIMEIKEKQWHAK